MSQTFSFDVLFDSGAIFFRKAREGNYEFVEKWTFETIEGRIRCLHRSTLQQRKKSVVNVDSSLLTSARRESGHFESILASSLEFHFPRRPE